MKVFLVSIRLLAFSLAFSPFFAAQSYADQNRTGGIYFEQAARKYISAGEPFDNPSIGSRLGLGYEMPYGDGDLGFGLLIGHTRSDLKGDGKPSNDVELYPIELKAKYDYPIGGRWYAGAAFAFGMLSHTTDKRRNSQMAGAMIYAEFIPDAEKDYGVYLGAGWDTVLEKDSSIALPAIEFGVRIRL